MFKKALFICIAFTYSLKASAYDPYRVRSITFGLSFPSINYELMPQQNNGQNRGDKLNYIPNSNSFFTLKAAFADLSVSLSLIHI